MDAGDNVEVHSRFTDSWSPGFVIDAVVEEGYRLRRLSDGWVLPMVTGQADLRPVSTPCEWDAVRRR